ncbi:DNA translocase FtsK 4TM domain-containing protein [Vibrio profundum]|uniref:DNA translocase FtsK n=1 Tax=Vibrio profundum TaxID=2910247 RepID=UPI003D12AE68
MFKQSKQKVETILKTGGDSHSFRLDGSQRLKECGLILAVLISMLLFVALLTFSPADPSWSQTAWGMHINNAGGFIGACVADTLFFTFGVLAYLVPILIAATAWVTFRREGKQQELDFMLWGTRVLGFVILLLTSCGLADINANDIWYFSSGGVIGDVLTSLALPTLNVLGSTLVFLFLWGAGFTLLTGISWLKIVEWLGDKSTTALTAMVNRMRGEQDELIEPQSYSADRLRAKNDVDTKNGFNANDSFNENNSFNANNRSDTTMIQQPDTSAPLLDPLDVETQNDSAVRVNEESAQRRFNIHVPERNESAREESVPQFLKTGTNDGVNTSLASSSETVVETHVHDLHATIEELEQSSAENLSSLVEFNEPEILPEPKPESKPELIAVDSTGSALMMGEPAVESVMTPNSVEPEEFTLDDSEPVSFAAIPESIEMEEERQQPTISSFEVVEEIESDLVVEPEVEPTETVLEPDQDIEAFQELVTSAQTKAKESRNPFLVQKDVDLPVPQEPMPTLEILYHPEKRENFIDRDALEDIARLVEAKLADYKIQAQVIDIFPGPVITRFELDLAPGVKVSRISGLSMDLARSLSAIAVRVVEVIPGKPYVGLELPNMSRQTVYFSDVVGSPQFVDASSPTTVVLGQDIAGDAVIADLAKMPHVLVAGTTGSGKSVGVNVMILSMLYKATPEEVRFIMIDPKMLELSIYEGIPHLLSEVVTDMKDASNALRWCVGEMERRYKLMSALGVRNIKGFNDKLKMAAQAGHPIHDPLWQAGDSMDPEAPLLENLPYIVVIIDEFADLMMVVGKKVEELIARLAQKARAAGIHLILATQRPSVDVITGLIKANIPTRVAFTVSTKTDSRTILDQGGAESLLGMGDMLYLPPGSSHTVRVHGAFASDDDVHAVVNNWKARGKPNYIDDITSGDQSPETLLPGEKMDSDEEVDPLFDQVVEHVVETRRGSVSGVQRRFKIGYNRAARIVEQLEMQGVVSAPGHNGNREVLAPAPGRDMN